MCSVFFGLLALDTKVRPRIVAIMHNTRKKAMPAQTAPRPTLLQIRAIATSGQVDERTVKRFLAGEPVRPMLRERIQAALAQHGFADLMNFAAGA
jgi:hypothetical protein